MSETKPIRTAPLSLWAIAQSFLNTLYALFGGPEVIAFRRVHSGEERALVLAWLRAGEALMRRLLLIEAAAYPKPNTRPLLHAKRAARVRPVVRFADDKPETWRVSFQAFSPPVHGGSGSRRRRETKGAETIFATRPLAKRYEALLRVYNAPAAFAKRLAARLHATPHRARELLRMPIRRRPRRSGETADTADLIGGGFALLDQAAHAACDTS